MLRILALALLLAVSSYSAKLPVPRCYKTFESYEGTLFEFLDNFYDCMDLGRSFVLDVSIDRQLPIRAKLSYDRKNYLRVLSDVLEPLGMEIKQGQYVDAVVPMDSRAYSPGAVGAVAGGVQVPGYQPSAAPLDSASRFLAVLGDSVAWTDSAGLRLHSLRDSLAAMLDYPVSIRFELALVSADTLSQYGISEPDFIASVTPRISGTPAVALNSYGIGLHMYNDTASDRQSLDFPVYDSLSIAVGPRKRISQATYSNGTVIESKFEDRQLGLTCSIERRRDTVSYSCEYSRDNEASDHVSFRNSLRVGESHSIAYRLSQTITTRQGGLFWWVPWLSENVSQRKRYLLAVGFSAEAQYGNTQKSNH